MTLAHLCDLPPRLQLLVICERDRHRGRRIIPGLQIEKRARAADRRTPGGVPQ